MVAVLPFAGPAAAGGSWFETTEKQYEPGDTVTISGWTSGGQLGWVEDGPFYGYLRVVQPEPATIERWPVIAPMDVALGPLHIERVGKGGYALRASLTFVLPSQLAPGSYEFLYCNDPCTTGLGDLVGGTVYVGVSPPTAETVPTVPPPTAPPPTIASTSTSTSTTVSAAAGRDRSAPPRRVPAATVRHGRSPRSRSRSSRPRECFSPVAG